MVEGRGEAAGGAFRVGKDVSVLGAVYLLTLVCRCAIPRSIFTDHQGGRPGSCSARRCGQAFCSYVAVVVLSKRKGAERGKPRFGAFFVRKKCLTI